MTLRVRPSGLHAGWEDGPPDGQDGRVQCTRCGNDVPASSSFCEACGEPVRPSAVFAAGPSPFSREASGSPPPYDEVDAPPGPPPTAASGSAASGSATDPAPEPYPPTRSVAEIVESLGNGLLGLVAVAVYGALQVLWALVVAVNGDKPSKAAFLVLGFVLVGAAAGATWVLAKRAQEARVEAEPVEVVHALSLGAGVLVTVYGVLVLFVAVLSTDARALTAVH
jgi:hypothetical protein